LHVYVPTKSNDIVELMS